MLTDAQALPVAPTIVGVRFAYVRPPDRPVATREQFLERLNERLASLGGSTLLVRQSVLESMAQWPCEPL